MWICAFTGIHSFNAKLIFANHIIWTMRFNSNRDDEINTKIPLSSFDWNRCSIFSLLLWHLKHMVFHVHYKFHSFSAEICFDGFFFIHWFKCYLFSIFFCFSIRCKRINIVSSQLLVYSWESSIMSVCNWILSFRPMKTNFF